MDVLSTAQIESALADLDGWDHVDGALTRTFRFADFARAVDFVEQVADVAESMQHHPDIDIRYNKVTLRAVTHSLGGVTARDVELAAAVHSLAHA
jgi:4a-hydroxytetrahydrobiopterin dehydratase